MLRSTVYKASQWIWPQRINTGAKGGKRQQEGGHSLENGIIIGLVQFFQVLPSHRGTGLVVFKCSNMAHESICTQMPFSVEFTVTRGAANARQSKWARMHDGISAKINTRRCPHPHPRTPPQMIAQREVLVEASADGNTCHDGSHRVIPRMHEKKKKKEKSNDTPQPKEHYQ